MDDRMVKFVAALRAAGVRISLAESQDAFAATQAVGVLDRRRFRTALQTTLVKDHTDRPTFDKLFPVYFGSGPRSMPNPDDQLTPEQIEQIRQALSMLAGELREMLERMLEGRNFTREELEQAAQRAGLDRARTMADQGWLSRRMAQQLGLAQVMNEIQSLLNEMAKAGANPRDQAEAQAFLEGSLANLQQQVRDFAGISLAERMRETVPQHLDDRPLMDIPFQNLSAGEIDRLKHEVSRLAARLRTRAALRQKRGKGRRLDPKSTLRANLRHGNVPFVLVHRVRRHKARFTLICDVSTSMRPVVSFLLLLMYQVQAQVGRTRSFAFIDHMEDISQAFEGQRPEHAVPEVLHRLPPGHYNTDLGRSLEGFFRDQLGAVDNRTTVIICGDGRNNYNPPRDDLIDQLARKARKLVWFNPEPPALWGTGDSDMPAYAPLADAVFQVANLRQLSQAVDQLFT
ncbi:MAG: VWA domain-containing protein [Anaerolineales bacterium]|jgi:hypothetical protein